MGPSAFNIVQDTEEEVSTETSVTEDILEILTESSVIASNIEEEKTIGTIKPVRKIRKVKKSLRLSPNPQYAVEEFTYVPADNNEINYDQEDNEIDSIGNNRNIPSLNNTKEPVFIENFENLRNITFRLTEDTRRKRKQETNVQRQKEFIVESNQVEFTEKNVKEKTNASSL